VRQDSAAATDGSDARFRAPGFRRPRRSMARIGRFRLGGRQHQPPEGGGTMADSATYDLNLILDPGLNEQQLQTEKDAVATQLARHDASVLEVDEWGIRRLAYPIRKLSEGYYLIYRLTMANDKPKAIEAALRQRDNVMRVLVVKDRPDWKTRKVKPEQPVEAPA
jgi:small subunit ribosomal protein S6